MSPIPADVRAACAEPFGSSQETHRGQGDGHDCHDGGGQEAKGVVSNQLLQCSPITLPSRDHVDDHGQVRCETTCRTAAYTTPRTGSMPRQLPPMPMMTAVTMTA